MRSRSAIVASVCLASLLSGPSAAVAAGPDEAALELGRQVFTQLAVPACAVCHTLEDAGAVGEIGPDLDALKPTAEQVASAVRGGVGIMPAFESLSDAQVAAVARYVAAAAAGELR